MGLVDKTPRVVTARTSATPPGKKRFKSRSCSLYVYNRRPAEDVDLGRATTFIVRVRAVCPEALLSLCVPGRVAGPAARSRPSIRPQRAFK
jgi:hypothetical protein